MNITVQSAGSQFSAMRSTTWRTGAGMSAGRGFRSSSSSNHAECSPVVETIRSFRPGQRLLGIDLLDDLQRIGDVGAAPAQARLGDLEIAAGRRLAAAHADAGGLHVEEAAALVLAQRRR